MKKAIVVFAALGTIVALRPVARRMGQKMSEHCEQMAAQCKQMAANVGGRGEPVGRT
jgi:hypothetical protein